MYKIKLITIFKNTKKKMNYKLKINRKLWPAPLKHGQNERRNDYRNGSLILDIQQTLTVLQLIRTMILCDEIIKNQDMVTINSINNKIIILSNRGWYFREIGKYYKRTPSLHQNYFKCDDGKNLIYYKVLT